MGLEAHEDQERLLAGCAKQRFAHSHARWPVIEGSVHARRRGERSAAQQGLALAKEALDLEVLEEGVRRLSDAAEDVSGMKEFLKNRPDIQ